MTPMFVGVRRVPAVVSAAALCLLAAACSPPPGPLASGAEPYEAGVPVPPVAYRRVLSGYVSQRPVEPSGWREQNERVAPQRSR